MKSITFKERDTLPTGAIILYTKGNGEVNYYARINENRTHFLSNHRGYLEFESYHGNYTNISIPTTYEEKERAKRMIRKAKREQYD